MTVHWRQFKSWLFEKNPDRSLPWRPIAEIGLILIWTVIVSQKLLDFSPLEWPHGREFGLAIQPHYIWQNLLECW